MRQLSWRLDYFRIGDYTDMWLLDESIGDLSSSENRA
jgi:hypothetical protein